MYLIVILLAMGLMQLWGDLNPLHRDEPFLRYRAALMHNKALAHGPVLRLFLVLAMPVGLTLGAELLLPTLLGYVFSVIVLLYSLGRGEFAPHVRSYTLSCTENNWNDAIEKAREQGVVTDGISVNDWPTLNHKMVEAVAYQGFERLFAVLFWFALFGPAGALLYRLSYLTVANSQNEAEAPLISRCLWAMEWPAVRLLGLSFAITGNFVSCVERWRSHLFNVESPTALVLRETALGALSADDAMDQSCGCTQREVSALKRLYARTFWLWLAGLAAATLI